MSTVATATVSDVRTDALVEFRPVHRQCATDPVVVTITAPAGLSFNDVVAALYLWMGEDPDELADPEYVRYLVVSSVFDRGGSALADAKDEIATVRPGSDAHDWLTTCRQRAAEVFLPERPADRLVRPTRRSPKAARTLVKAGA